MNAKKAQWIVNVWFNGQVFAEVSRPFRTEEEARSFAKSYDSEEYDDATVRVFRPDGSVA